jgi:hypothetical protein
VSLGGEVGDGRLAKATLPWLGRVFPGLGPSLRYFAQPMRAWAGRTLGRVCGGQSEIRKAEKNQGFRGLGVRDGGDLVASGW